MSATVTLFTDRTTFESMWRPALEAYGLSVRTGTPSSVPNGAGATGSVMILDGGSESFDEDELLTMVGFARAIGARPVVHLPDEGMSTVDDVLDELCGGLVVRGDDDVQRMAAAIARRSDRERSRRFEFVTVSPRGTELLAILGDGRSMLLSRPVGNDDDGSDVVSIDLAEDASTATLGLQSGGRLRLQATDVSPTAGNGASNGDALAVDGARLGARLRELRLAAGLTQAELARRTGIHRPNIARVEAGRHTPSLETLARLASAIGVPTTRVLSGE